jgi:hypothetical protein
MASVYDCFACSPEIDDWDSFLPPSDDQLCQPTPFFSDDCPVLPLAQASSCVHPASLQNANLQVRAAGGNNIAWDSLFKAFVESYAHLFANPPGATMSPSADSTTQFEAGYISPQSEQHQSPVMALPELSFFDGDISTSSDSGSEKSVKSPNSRISSRRSSRDAKESAPVSFSGRITKRRVPHNEVERKYRDGLNKQLERLRNAVPSLKGQERISKTEVLSNAISYIYSLEETSRRIQKEKDMLCTLISNGKDARLVALNSRISSLDSPVSSQHESLP